MDKVVVGLTSKNGKGLFATRKIRKGEILFSVKGRMIKDTYGPEYQIGSRWLAIGNRVWISPHRTNPWWYINHSCNPNAGMKNRITVVAMHDIPDGKEITIDYSITEIDPYWRMKCNCGSQNCRKIIRSISFLPKSIFIRYDSFIARFARRAYSMNS